LGALGYLACTAHEQSEPQGKADRHARNEPGEQGGHWSNLR
jgi:hypothetical protein